MKNLKLAGMVLALLALIVVPAIALAQSAINVSINAPANNVEVAVGQSVTFTGQATGGDVSTYSFNWTWGDGTQTTSTNNNGQTSTTHTFDQLGTKTVELRVVDIDANIDTQTVTVNVVGAVNKLEVSNVQVSNVTANSAVITWTTNKPATSRVIYDTVSRPNILDASAPNYSYANSTGTSNQSPMVTSHSVTVTGLSASTQYFFRVVSEIPAN